jgi:NAD(P)H-hydrate repair Nnr-like enzyme with NAD(P)H-hydrate epimerase domain
MFNRESFSRNIPRAKLLHMLGGWASIRDLKLVVVGPGGGGGAATLALHHCAQTGYQSRVERPGGPAHYWPSQ